MMSFEIARCLARLAGDGNINRKYLRYNNTCPTLLHSFEKDILILFPDLHLTKGIGNSGTSFIQAQRKDVLDFFFQFLASFKSADIFIPEHILNADIEIKREYLKAFFDDEGSPSLRLHYKTQEWKRSINICSKSYKMLWQIKELLEYEFGISSGKIMKEYKKGTDRFWYTLIITGRENIATYAKTIGFMHPVKIQRLEFALTSYENTFDRNQEGFKKLLNDYRKIKKNPIQG